MVTFFYSLANLSSLINRKDFRSIITCWDALGFQHKEAAENIPSFPLAFQSQLSFCRCLVVTMVSYGCFVSRLCSVSESSPDGTLHLDLSSRVVKPWEGKLWGSGTDVRGVTGHFSSGKEKIKM